MTIAEILQPATILFVIGFTLGSFAPQLRNREHMMFCKFAGDGVMSLYLLSLGGLAGACAAAIASIGALTQAITPQRYMQQTIWLRIGLACILSVAAIYFVYQTPVDILPIAMVIICRFGELQHKAQNIRIVYFLTCFPWLVYHVVNGFYLPLIACVIRTTSLLIALIRHRNTDKDEPLKEVSTSS